MSGILKAAIGQALRTRCSGNGFRQVLIPVRQASIFAVKGSLPAYNVRMKTALRPLFVAAFAALPLAAALAQAPAAAPNAATAPLAASADKTPARSDKKIEHIRTEDGGTRIDELRVGGETEKITVQPKTGGPAYEVKPAEGARGTAPASANNDTNGSRVWNVLKF